MAGFYGSYTVMVTPYEDAVELHEARLRHFIGWQSEGRMQGLIPPDSTGEFPSLTREERGRVGAILVGQAAGRVP